MINNSYKPTLGWLFVSFFIFSLTAVDALPEKGTISCKAPNEEDQRVWKYSKVDGLFEFWTLHAEQFYSFCTFGYSIQFPTGFLCAYDADRKIGTVATFIDLQKARVTDILIWEDTMLNDPDTWRQKSETTCELIRD